MFDIGLPESFAHIHPVFGELIEIRFATVENVLYGVVIENATEDRWALCYAAQAFGFELLWMLRAVDRRFRTETLEIYNNHVVDVSMMEDDNDNMLVIT